jgi:preprotein translocase subunit SecE
VGKRFVQYMRDVRAELGKVLWPKRAEVVNYSTVVLTTLVFLALLIFGLNFLFARGVAFLFRS